MAMTIRHWIDIYPLACVPAFEKLSEGGDAFCQKKAKMKIKVERKKLTFKKCQNNQKLVSNFSKKETIAFVSLLTISGAPSSFFLLSSSFFSSIQIYSENVNKSFAAFDSFVPKTCSNAFQGTSLSLLFQRKEERHHLFSSSVFVTVVEWLAQLLMTWRSWVRNSTVPNLFHENLHFEFVL